MNKNNSFILLRVDKDTFELMKDKNAFILLTQIALKTKLSKNLYVSEFKTRKVIIRDYKNIGLTEQKYRSAKIKLEKLGFATFKGTNKGTIVTLLKNNVFDLNQKADIPFSR